MVRNATLFFQWIYMSAIIVALLSRNLYVSAQPTTIASTAQIDTNTKGNAKCGTIFDLGMILDVSDSIKNKLPQAKSFLKKLVEGFSISENGTHAGVVTFSKTAQIRIKLDDHYKQSSFNQAVDEIRNTSRGTYIGVALETTWEQLFNPLNGARKNVSRLIILITDGKNMGPPDPVIIGEKIRQDGIDTFGVGLGDSYNGKELTDILGGNEKLFTAKWGFESNNSFINNITKTTINCQQGVAKPTSPTFPCVHLILPFDESTSQGNDKTSRDSHDEEETKNSITLLERNLLILLGALTAIFGFVIVFLVCTGRMKCPKKDPKKPEIVQVNDETERVHEDHSIGACYVCEKF